MPVDEVIGQAWTRKHDHPARPEIPSAPRTAYPKSLEDLIEICSRRQPFERIRAAGSHWALSRAAISDSVFVETHDPDNLHQAMGRTLYDVVPPCLNADFVRSLARRVVPPFDEFTVAENQGVYPIHIETGKRVYQLYSELDAGDDDPRSLAVLLSTAMGNASYLGSWGFHTLGGAGGQTVLGALATGTHGGDFRLPPIADAVLALHLVADGGKHYWIEPQSLTHFEIQLTDDELLRALYGQERYGGPRNFEIIRDSDIFDSVLVSAGRFGIIYSIVLAAVRQYCLHQERRLTTWQAIKSQLGDPTSALYTQQDQPTAPPSPNRFLQVVVSLTPHANFSKNLAGVTKRWNVPLARIPGSSEPAGRPERRGPIVNPFDPAIQAPRFALAGDSFPYSPDPDHPGMALPPNFLERACSNADFTDGVIETAIAEVRDFIDNNAAGALILAITVPGVGPALLSLAAPLLVLLPLLAALLSLFRSMGRRRFGQVMNDVKDTLLNRSDPAERAAGVFVWQMIAFEAFSSQQQSQDFEAISYAVMDGHDYFDKSCNINVDSIEVFFDATDPMLIAYVDALLAFEIGQEVNAGRAFVGYISLRFTGPTRALIGQQRFSRSCAVEVAGLRDVSGVTELIDFAITLALDRNFNGILHWGQRNESTRVHIQERFGDTLEDQSGNLHRWRSALGRITEHGKLDGFSSAFTRRTGLEIVTPVIRRLTASGFSRAHPITIIWDCDQNPPDTRVTLHILSPSGTRSSLVTLPLVGWQQIVAPENGAYLISLVAGINLAGELRQVSQEVRVAIG